MRIELELIVLLMAALATGRADGQLGRTSARHGQLSPSTYVELHQSTNRTFNPYMPVVVVSAIVGGVVLAVASGIHTASGQLSVFGVACYVAVIAIGFQTDVRSSGLQDFIFARIHSAAALWKTMNQRSKYYAAIRPETLHIKDLAPRIRSSFRKMKELHADSTFPDVYFLIGRMNSGGTTGHSGFLIGADMFGKGLVFPADELDEWLRTAVDSVSNIPYTVAHELIHYQQKTEGKTLLAAAIQEGSVDFIGELISGGALDKEVRAYGRQHEKELWIQFTKEMNGTGTSPWMYEGKVTNGRPADLGYFVGYRIAEAYYNQFRTRRRRLQPS